MAAVSSTETTTDNYYTVALGDDRKVETPTEEPAARGQADDKASRAAVRQARIAAAVERSKTEYQPEHAYTERSTSSSISRQEAKVEKYKLEHLVTSLYYGNPPEYGQIVQLVLEALDEQPKAVLSREVLDTSLQAALKTGNTEAGVRLAALTEPHWKTSFAGLAATASDAYLAAGRSREAAIPLLTSISSYGFHEPTLQRLVDVLLQIQDDETEPAGAHLKALTAAAQSVLRNIRPLPSHSLFDNPPHPIDAAQGSDTIPIPPEAVDLDAIDTVELSAFFALEGKQAQMIQGVLRRMQKALKSKEVEEVHEERGVRQL